jgi:hypothetical protein
MHLDFHTGLGPWGDYKLLIDTPLTDPQMCELVRWYGSEYLEASQPQGIAYDSRGGFDNWCSQLGLAEEYMALCAEFGTYSAVKVLAGVRAENQAHHWDEPGSRRDRKTKNWLRELFCPASLSWRASVIKKSLRLIHQTIRGMEEQV